MKIFSRFIAVLAAVLCFASCEKDPVAVNTDPEEVNLDRDIFYSVTNIIGMPSFSGTTAHVSTEAEWDALLDRFCDMTRDGEQVTFRNITPSGKSMAKAGGSNGSNTITTQSREDLKAWMKEMERAGKTVNVTFNSGTGTWHGVAYATYNPQTDMTEERTCSGSLVITPVNIVEDSSPAYVLALKSSNNDIFVFTVHGMMMFCETEEPATLIDGYEVSLTGMVSTFNDINGNVLMTLELDVNEGDVINFEK